MMKKGGTGGGNTITGLKFESRVNLEKVISELINYTIVDDVVYYKKEKVAELYSKHKLYKNLLEPNGVDYLKIMSKRLIPDGAILILKDKIMYIVEIKFQVGVGSVDEKLQTCDFKNKQYQKLLSPLRITVRYVYVLSDWFKDEKYKDALTYVQSVGCYYFFNELPLDFLGLPVPEA